MANITENSQSNRCCGAPTTNNSSAAPAVQDLSAALACNESPENKAIDSEANESKADDSSYNEASEAEDSKFDDVDKDLGATCPPLPDSPENGSDDAYDEVSERDLIESTEPAAAEKGHPKKHNQLSYASVMESEESGDEPHSLKRCKLATEKSTDWPWSTADKAKWPKFEDYIE